MRILTHAVAAVLALLIGMGLGYFRWGLQVTDLTRRIQQQQLDCTSRLSEAQRRAKAAEEQARHEAESRKVLEEELQRVHPQK